MRAWMVGVLAAAAVTTACTSVVTGTGQAGSAPRPVPTASADFPTPSGGSSGSGSAAPPSSPPATVRCPTVTYAYAHLRFGCIDNALTLAAADQVWPLNLVRGVEPGWQLAEGAGHWGAPDGHSLQQITAAVRQQMVDGGAYGPNVAVKTLADRATKVAGAGAWLLQTEFTINAAYRAQNSLRVKVERSWIVALQVGPDDVSLWYVTLPDDVSSLWGKVPSLMDTIRVI